MLSYRHAFHAGNHADVLKHCVLVQLLRHFNQKDKPWWFIDTHAGAGAYALDSEYARKNAEFAGGIGRLWDVPNLPPALADYVAQVRAVNADGKLRHYPGSPLIACSWHGAMTDCGCSSCTRPTTGCWKRTFSMPAAPWPFVRPMVSAR